MKRIIVCIGILSIFIIASIFALLHIKNCTETISVQLDNIIFAINNNDSTLALNTAKEAKDYWDKNCVYTFFYLHQNDIIEINSSLARIIGLIEADCEEIVSECKTLKTYISLIYITQLPTLENIL